MAATEQIDWVTGEVDCAKSGLLLVALGSRLDSGPAKTSSQGPATPFFYVGVLQVSLDADRSAQTESRRTLTTPSFAQMNGELKALFDEGR